jgi:UDP-glucose 4-epimerase
MAHVLVTGGAGFIGSHLVDLHLTKGDTVAVIDNLTTGQKSNLAQHDGNPRLTFHHVSLQDCKNLPDIVRGVDLVYHMAAVVGVRQVLKSPINVLDSNIIAVSYLFKTLVEHAPKARVITASSSETYGLQNNVPFKELDDLVLPSRDPLRWCYAVTKLADEMIVYAYSHEHKMNATACRLFNTSGPRQSSAYGMVVPNFVEKAIKNIDIDVFGDGLQTRSFCDVRDMVAALEALSRCNTAQGITVNVGTDREISIQELAERVIEIAKSKSGIRHITYEEGYGINFVDVKRRRPDLTRLQELTGYKSRFNLDDTINSLITERKAMM